MKAFVGRGSELRALVVSQPERSTSTTAAISRSPMEGNGLGIRAQ